LSRPHDDCTFVQSSCPILSTYVAERTPTFVACSDAAMSARAPFQRLSYERHAIAAFFSARMALSA
jgi:hypothetical protein